VALIEALNVTLLCASETFPSNCLVFCSESLAVEYAQFRSIGTLSLSKRPVLHACNLKPPTHFPTSRNVGSGIRMHQVNEDLNSRPMSSLSVCNPSIMNQCPMSITIQIGAVKGVLTKPLKLTILTDSIHE
jgi:hypothetical protein